MYSLGSIFYNLCLLQIENLKLVVRGLNPYSVSYIQVWKEIVATLMFKDQINKNPQVYIQMIYYSVLTCIFHGGAWTQLLLIHACLDMGGYY